MAQVIKICPNCHEEFTTDKSHPHQKYCSKPDCQKARKAAYRAQWSRDNPERARDVQRRANKNYRERHPEKCREATRRWLQANREHFNAQVRLHHQKKREEERRRRWHSKVQQCKCCGLVLTDYDKVVEKFYCSQDCYEARNRDRAKAWQEKYWRRRKTYDRKYYQRHREQILLKDKMRKWKCAK